MATQKITKQDAINAIIDIFKLKESELSKYSVKDDNASFLIDKREFERFEEREKIKLYDNLSDVIETDIQLSVGDRIMFTNDYGVTFGPHEVLGFCEPTQYGNCIYFEHDAYWYPCKVTQITKL